MPAIEINGLTKQYPVRLEREAVNAVDNLNLTVEQGEICGFLGPNGAGKTATIEPLLAGLALLVLVAGLALRRNRRAI